MFLPSMCSKLYLLPVLWNSYLFPICVGNLSVYLLPYNVKLTSAFHFKITGTNVEKLCDEKAPEIQNADSSARPRSKESFETNKNTRRHHCSCITVLTRRVVMILLLLGLNIITIFYNIEYSSLH